jgi:hypothetical protein
MFQHICFVALPLHNSLPHHATPAVHPHIIMIIRPSSCSSSNPSTKLWEGIFGLVQQQQQWQCDCSSSVVTEHGTIVMRSYLLLQCGAAIRWAVRSRVRFACLRRCCTSVTFFLFVLLCICALSLSLSISISISLSLYIYIYTSIYIFLSLFLFVQDGQQCRFRHVSSGRYLAFDTVALEKSFAQSVVIEKGGKGGGADVNERYH